MSTNLGIKVGWLGLAVLAGAVFVAPAARATPVNYDFAVNVTTGPLAGTVQNGSFSYDTSVIIPGGLNDADDLLTGLAFTLNNIAFSPSSANTGWLGFNAAGELISFGIGTNCHLGSCSVYNSVLDTEWWVSVGSSVGPNDRSFGCSIETNDFDVTCMGTATYALAAAGPVDPQPPRSVPEPAALVMFGLGLLLIGGLVGFRRRAD